MLSLKDRPWPAIPLEARRIGFALRAPRFEPHDGAALHAAKLAGVEMARMAAA
jgi:hypothetical protein